MNFLYQIYYGIINAINSPARMLDSFSGSHPTRKALILGVPAVLIGIAAVSSAIWAQFSTNDGRIERYQAAAESTEELVENTNKLIEAKKSQVNEPGDELTLSNDVENAIAKYESDDLKLMEVADLEEKKREFLDEWAIYLHKLIELEPAKFSWKFSLAKCAQYQGQNELYRTLILQLAPEDQPGHSEAQFRRAFEYLKLKVYGKAQLHFELALQSNSEYSEARLGLISCLMAQSQFKRADQLLHEKIGDESFFRSELPGDPRILLMGRRIKIGMGGGSEKVSEEVRSVVQDAQSVFYKLVYQSDVDSRLKYWNNLLGCYMELKNYDLAEELMRELIKNPPPQKAKNGQVGDLEERRAAYKRVLSQVYTEMAREVSFGTSRFSEERSLEYLRKAYIEDSENRSALQLISIGVLRGDKEYGEKLTSLYAPMEDPNPPAEVRIVIGNFLSQKMEQALKDGNQEEYESLRDQAIGHFEKCREELKNNPQVLNNLAYLLLKQGDERLDEALQLSERALTLQRRRGAPIQKSSEFYHTLGSAQLKKGIALYKSGAIKPSQDYFTKANASFSDARKGRPDSVDILQNMVICQQYLGNTIQVENLNQRIEALLKQQGAGG